MKSGLRKRIKEIKREVEGEGKSEASQYSLVCKILFVVFAWRFGAEEERFVQERFGKSGVTDTFEKPLMAFRCSRGVG